MILFSILVFLGLLREAFGDDEDWKSGLDGRGPVDVPLEVFEVKAPLRENYGGTSCTKIVLQHDFTASYGSPYVGMASPHWRRSKY